MPAGQVATLANGLRLMDQADELTPLQLETIAKRDEPSLVYLKALKRSPRIQH